MSQLPRSVLKHVIDNLPENFKMKPESTPNQLKKQGVKDEELEFSGTNEKILGSGLGKITKQDLQAIERERDDIFGHARIEGAFSGTTVPTTDQSSYGADIRRFRSMKDTRTVDSFDYDPRTDEVIKNSSQVPARRNVDSHFEHSDEGVGDYLWHTRSDDTVLDDIPTHRVQEIQSDLHQRGQHQGYDRGTSGTPERTPFKKNWATKALEQEMLTAAEKGKPALAVPLEGPGTQKLSRSAGVQRWYANDIRNTMKKLAKRVGGEYRETNPANSNRGNQPITQIDVGLTGDEAIIWRHNLAAELESNFKNVPLARAQKDAAARQGLMPSAMYVSELAGAMRTGSVDAYDILETIPAALGYKARPKSHLMDMYDAGLLTEQEFEIYSRNWNKREFWRGHPNVATMKYEPLTQDNQFDNIEDVVTFAKSAAFSEKLSDSLTAQFDGGANTFAFKQTMIAYNKTKRTAGIDPDIGDLQNWVSTLPLSKIREEMPALLGLRKLEYQTGVARIGDAIGQSELSPAQEKEFVKLIKDYEFDIPAQAMIEMADMYDNQFFWKEYPNLHKLKFEPLETPTVKPAEDIVYGQIVLPKGEDWKEKLTLYSAAGATAMGGVLAPDDAEAADALDAEITSGMQFLVDEQGMSPEEAHLMVQEELAQELEALREEGYSEEELEAEFGDFYTMPSPEVDPTIMEGTTPEPMGESKYELIDVVDPIKFDSEMQEQLLNSATAAAKNVTDEFMPFFGEMKAKYWDEDGEATRHYKEREKAITYHTANVLRNMGYDVTPDEESGDLMWTRPGGETVPITPAFWDEVQAMELELAGAVGGGVGALRLASQVPFFGRWAKGLATAGGVMVGATSGRMLDGAKNAWFTRQHLKNDYYERRFKDSIVGNATYEVVGGAAFMALKGGSQGLGWIHDTFVKGNREGAMRALKEHMNLDDEQVQAITDLWKRHTDPTGKSANQTDEALTAVMMTQPGGEAFVGAASGFSSRMGTTVKHSIDKRAKDLLHNVDNLSYDNVGTVLYDELNKYDETVKSYYGSIKKFGTTELKDTNYKFDYDALAIDPLLDHMEKSMTNPAVLERFLRLTSKMREIGAPDAPRDFETLLELRSAVNEFRYNTKITQAAGIRGVKKITDNLNNEITHAAKTYMPNSDVWLKEWSKANIEYGKMKDLRRNALYKALKKPGITPDKVIKALKNNVDAIDGTFMEVVGKLPPKVRAQAEGAVFETLAKRHTVGETAGMQAINFPELAQSLKHIGFSDPQARSLKRAVNEMAEVFKNDVHLARVTGHVGKPAFQSYLTTDPIVRAKYELASGMFNYVKRLLPGEKGREIALITRLSKVMENPRSASAVEELMRGLPDDPALRNSLHTLAIQTAKFGEQNIAPKVEIYRTVVPGQAGRARQGKLGSGIYYTTDKSKATSRAADTGAKVENKRILPRRIAGEEDLIEISGTEEYQALLDDPRFVQELKDRGFDGITAADEILIFK